MTGASLAIYFFSADYRENDFYQRLKNKAENTAKLLIEVDEVNTELLTRIERDNPINLPRERISIYNFKNEELYSSDTDNQLPVDPSLLNKIRLEGEIRYKYMDYEVLGFLFAHQYDRFTVVAAATDIYGLKKLDNLKKILFTVFGISVLLVSVAAWIYAGKALNPITDIVNEVDQISAANLNLRLKESKGGDELAKLSRTFNEMLDRLESSFLSQKNFIANASHELRTPITALAGEIEVALMQTRSPEEYIRVLHSLLEDSKNLSALSTQLLLLAQTSTVKPSHTFRPIRVDEILWEVKEEMLRAHVDYQVYIEFELTLNDESLVVKGDEQWIKVVFSNLMENGCKYSSDHKVNVRLKAGDQEVVIYFEDNGIGIPKEDASNIFDPFFRGKNTTNIKGHGIGLSLASGIMKLHHGTISLDQSEENITRFVVTFPNISTFPKL